MQTTATCVATEERLADFEYRIDEYNATNDQRENSTADGGIQSTTYDDYWFVFAFMCRVQRVQLTWSIIEITTVLLLLYGIKARRWGFLVPHLALWGVCLLLITVGFLISFGVSLILISHSDSIESNIMTLEQARLLTILITIVLGFILVIFAYVFMCMVRCCQFLKGMSYANILPIVYPSRLVPVATVIQRNTPALPTQGVYPEHGLSGADIHLEQLEPPPYATVASTPEESKASW